MASRKKAKGNHKDRALTLLKGKRFSEARKLLILACKDNPADIESWFYLGALSGQMGSHNDAEKCFQKVTIYAPGNHQAHYNLGIAQRDQSLFSKASNSFSVATKLAPNNAIAFRELAFALQKCERHKEAAIAFEHVISLLPQEAASYSSHADACLLAGDIYAAIASLNELIKLKPKVSSVHTRLGDANFRLGELEAAIKHYQEAIRLEPTDPVCGSKLLHALNFSTKHPLPKLFTEARRWGMLHLRHTTVTTTHISKMRSSQKIRIGYMTGSSQSFKPFSHILPLLTQFDNSRFDIFCYGESPASAINNSLKGSINIEGMDPSIIAESIMADEINILVDLTGHDNGNILAALTVQPAPIQISYPGYPYTTGLPSIQYRITDTSIDPETSNPTLYTEKLLRLNRCAFYYHPENNRYQRLSPRNRNPNTSMHLGVVTELASLNDIFITILREILSNIKNIELYIFNADIADEKVRKHAESKLRKGGIPVDAVRWQPQGKTEEAQLKAYEQLDLLLDTTPICRATTICQALWAGVPVVTLAGDKPSSRIGKSIIESAGFSELVQNSAEAVINKAVTLLDNQSTLTELKESLHQRITDSPLCDSKDFVRSIEGIYTSLYSIPE